MLAPPLLSKSKALLIHFNVERACLISADDGVGVLTDFNSVLHKTGLLWSAPFS